MATLRDSYDLQTNLDLAYQGGYDFCKPGIPAVKADGNITITDSANLLLAADTIRVAGIVFTAINGGTPTITEFDASGTDIDTAVNLKNAINAHPAVYPLVIATVPNILNPYIYIEAMTAGAAGNLIPIKYTSNTPGSLGMMTSADTLQNGADTIPAGGSYLLLQSGLATAADNGQETFTVKIMCNFNPAILRLGTKYWEAFKTGAMTALATERIYNYEVSLTMDTTDTIDLKINFNFTF